jgi:hypothetical protein
MALPLDPAAALRLLGEPPRSFSPEVVQRLRGARPGLGAGWASVAFGLLCLGVPIADRLIDRPTMPARGAVFSALVGLGLVAIGWHLRRRALRHRARVRRALPQGPAVVGRIEKALLSNQGMLRFDIAYGAPDGRACRTWGNWQMLPGYEGPGTGSSVLLLLDPEDATAATVFPLDYPELEDTPLAAAPPPAATPLDALQATWRAHQAEVEGQPEPAERARILMTWRAQIDEHAHDYADLVAGAHDDEMVRAEVEAIMTAWMAGHLARLGYFNPFQALQCAHQLGRALRDRARERGLPIDQCQASLGVRMDQALRSIVEQALGR